MHSTTWISVRRLLDLMLTVIVFVVTSPIMLITAILIRRDGGPVMFLQPRVGYNGQVFQIYKFRSMIVDADQFLDERGMPTRDRITPIGKTIRRTSIDELPQLLNVLKGDMAIIGPRPILPKMLPYMTKEERRRFSVRPGITGWAQVMGRNMIPWSRRFELDIAYVDTASPMRDLVILFMTAKRVISRSDIVQDRNTDQVDDVTNRTPESSHVPSTSQRLT